jgi:hypothetical protein
MRIEKKNITRKALHDLLSFLDSDANKVNGEELGHPSPREIAYLFKDHHGNTEMGASNAQCSKLVWINPGTSLKYDHGGLNSFNVKIDVVDTVLIRRGGLAHDTATEPTPARILCTIAAFV